MNRPSRVFALKGRGFSRPENLLPWPAALAAEGRTFALAAIFFLFALLSTPAHAVDRNAFTFTRYALTTTIAPDQGGLDVTGTIELRNDSKQPQPTASLQVSSSLEWRAVAIKTAQGIAPLEWLAQTYSSDIDHTGALSEAIVKFDEPIAPGKTVTLQVHYAGTISREATRLTRIGTPEAVAVRSEWDQIGPAFTAFRGLGYVTWYPVSIEAVSLSNGNEVFNAIAEWKQRHAATVLALDCAHPFVAKPDSHAADTIVDNARSRNEAGKACRLEFALDGPGPLIAVGKYQTIDRSEPGRPGVVVYHLAEHTSLARDYTVAAENALRITTDWFGAPVVPLTIIELADPDALPFEAGNLMLTPLKPTPAKSLEVGLARSAFHASHPDWWRPWIRNGLATLAQALVREKQDGRKAALAYLNQFVNALAVAETAPSGPESEESSSKPNAVAPHEPLVLTSDQLFLRTKAGFVWWMLRDMVGDDALKLALRNYKPNDDHEPSYIQRLLEQASSDHRSLEPFFDTWVYRDRGLADFNITAAYPRKMMSSKSDMPTQWVVTVTVENNSDVWAEVPVTVRSDAGERVERVASEPRQKAVVRIPLASPPTEAVVNDGSIPEADLEGNRVAVAAPAGEAK